MSSVTTCYNARYAAAIALNNAAVTLLERACYKDSVDTFRASISIIQTILEKSRKPRGSYLPLLFNADTDINRHVQEASRRCAMACIPNAESTVATMRETFNLIRISSQADPSAVVDTLRNASRAGKTRMFICVVIEPLDPSEICLESIGLDVDAIIYNVGVAHCLLANQFSLKLEPKSESCLTDELRRSAFQLFCLIEPFFMSRLSEYPFHFHDRTVLLLCTLFAHTLSEVAQHLQYATVNERCKSILHLISHSICVQEMLVPSKHRPAAAA